MAGANGIIVKDDYLIVANYGQSKLIKVPVKDGKLNGALSIINGLDSHVLNGPDGLVEVNDNVIIAITGSNAILIESDDDFASAEVKKAVNLAAIDPPGSTTAALKSDD